MKKQNNIIYWVMGIIVLFLVANIYQPSEEPKMVGLMPHYYLDGVEVYPKFPFSIVEGTFDEIMFNIYGSETQGNPITDLHITDAFPQVFKDALPTTIQTLDAYETDKLLWVSGKISASQFESLPQPVEFMVEVTGAGTTEQGFTSLKISAGPEPVDSSLYCSVGMETTSGSNSVDRVQFSDLDVSNVGGYGSHNDLTENMASVLKGNTYDIFVTIGQSGTYNQFVKVLIDFNKNRAFEANEMFEIGSCSSDGCTVQSTINIPAEAISGATMMRILQQRTSYPGGDGCATIWYGEAEDYTVFIN